MTEERLNEIRELIETTEDGEREWKYQLRDGVFENIQFTVDGKHAFWVDSSQEQLKCLVREFDLIQHARQAIIELLDQVEYSRARSVDDELPPKGINVDLCTEVGWRVGALCDDGVYRDTHGNYLATPITFWRNMPDGYWIGDLDGECELKYF